MEILVNFEQLGLIVRMEGFNYKKQLIFYKSNIIIEYEKTLLF